MKTTAYGTFVIFVMSLLGCGTSGSVTDNRDATQRAAATVESLKPRLVSIGESGEAGSAMAGLKEAIESLDNQALSDDLLKDLAELEKPGNSSDQIKTIAKRMAGKL